jgi:hypothetical protein
LEYLAQKFAGLNVMQKRLVHLRLGENALRIWHEYVSDREHIYYVETVAGTRQKVDIRLPDDAFCSARRGRDLANVELRYREPIVALQDDDLEFPGTIRFAYYSLYNLFTKYALGEAIDDWLIVNQALSAEIREDEWSRLLTDAMRLATIGGQ